MGGDGQQPQAGRLLHPAWGAGPAPGAATPFAQDEPDILLPGRNCWRIERAARAALLVDAAAYFAALRAALARARRSIFILGWDIDSRTELIGAADDGLPLRLGELEVKQLYLDAIAAARRHIYIENQYLTSAAVGEALAARLREPDGPEVVVVSRRGGGGWLEQYTMEVLRARLLQRLRAADARGRLRVL